jgi:hypothetical protein
MGFLLIDTVMLAVMLIEAGIEVKEKREGFGTLLRVGVGL